MNTPLSRLSTANLRVLASSFKTGVLSHGASLSALEQIVGSAVENIAGYFVQLENVGFTNVQMITLIESIIDTREDTPAPESIFELVLSGPDVPGIHTCDTAATMRVLIGEAKESLLLVGYAVHNARDLFEPIAHKLEEISGFSARFCLDVSRTHGDTSLGSEIVRRFITEFKEKHWPWQVIPELYYDPRALDPQSVAGHSCLHAKCIIADHKVALVTSANFTEAAQFRNIEAGILIRHLSMIQRLEGYFAGLIGRDILVRCI